MPVFAYVLSLSVAQLYFTLSNNNTDPAYTDQRNVLVLCVSSDLNTWSILRTLLVDDTGLAPADSVRYTGFHYVDWQVRLCMNRNP